MEKDGFSWWVRRIQRAMDLFDEFRIDHFRGFAGFWAVPSGNGCGFFTGLYVTLYQLVTHVVFIIHTCRGKNCNSGTVEGQISSYFFHVFNLNLKNYLIVLFCNDLGGTWKTFV